MISPDQVAQAMWREDEASRSLGMKLEEVAAGRARLSMTVEKHMTNAEKLCHGGYIFALADSAFAYACNAHNQRTLAASASIDYLAPAFVDDRLTAEARQVERRIYDVKVVNQKGETVALFRGTSATKKGTWI